MSDSEQQKAPLGDDPYSEDELVDMAVATIHIAMLLDGSFRRLRPSLLHILQAAATGLMEELKVHTDEEYLAFIKSEAELEVFGSGEDHEEIGDQSIEERLEEAHAEDLELARLNRMSDEERAEYLSGLIGPNEARH